MRKFLFILLCDCLFLPLMGSLAAGNLPFQAVRNIEIRSSAIPVLPGDTQNVTAGGDPTLSIYCEDGLIGCQVMPETGGSQPAVNFAVPTPQTVHIEADVWGSADCPGDPDAQVADDLDLDAGNANVYLGFDPPLPDETLISLKWRVARCSTVCINYVIGRAPASCAALVACVNAKHPDCPTTSPCPNPADECKVGRTRCYCGPR